METTHKHSQREAYEIAESISRKLKHEVEKTVDYCKKDMQNLDSWLGAYFQPALDVLNSKEPSPVRKLSLACNHLQVFGGMGSWTDSGESGNAPEGLFDVYTEANNFYQECWEQGIV